MSNRIEARFKALAEAKRSALITFIMGGDPDMGTSRGILAQLPEAGADLIEVGMPFSEPMADGPVIQAAGLRALRAGVKLQDILALVHSFREADTQTPIILMGYYNPVYCYGVQKFCKAAATAGVDGMILVDLPPEEEEEFTAAASPLGLHLIRLIAPTSDDARLALIARNGSGFLYYVSVAGITGSKSADMDALRQRVSQVKSQTSLPVAVGFGIRTPAQASQVAEFSDGVVVGSALIEALERRPEEAMNFVRSLRKAMGSKTPVDF